MKKLFVMLALFLCVFLASAAYGMTRSLKRDPAIVITAFGTTTVASATFDFFEAQLKKEAAGMIKNYPIEWSFTSEIVRERANRAFKEKGIDKYYKSLPQVLANLEAEGYRKVVVQPLHIFAGQEYQEVVKTVKAFKSLGLRIELGYTLTHDWEMLFESIAAIESEFLTPDQGCNVIAIHGSPLTFIGTTGAYVGMDRYLEHKYQNTFVGAMDGLLTAEQALNKAKNCAIKRIKYIPYLFVAGDHIMNDVMAAEADEDGAISWSLELQQAGFKTETIYVRQNGHKLYKGLGFYKKINHLFIRSLIQALKRLETF